MPPFKHHVFICTNERSADDPKGSCMRRGAGALHAHAKERCHALGLKGHVRVNKAGCLDTCAEGPAVVVYGAEDPSEGVWYTVRNTEEMDTIIDAHLVRHTPVEALRMKVRSKPES